MGKRRTRLSPRGALLTAALLAFVSLVLAFSEAGMADVTLASAPLRPAPAAPPAAVAATDGPVAEPAAPEAPAAGPCAEALDWVAGAGLPLPAGVGYHCPSTEFDHNGAACWYSEACPGLAFIAVNLDRMPDASVEYLHHVVAHEVCHIVDWQSAPWTTEAGADACAAAHGAPG